MRTLLLALALLVGLGFAAQAQAGYDICQNQGTTANSPCGALLDDPQNPGVKCLGNTCTGAGERCTPNPEDPNNSFLLYKSATCVLSANPADATSDLPEKQKPISFVPNVPIPGLFESTAEVTGATAGEYIRAIYIYFVGVVGVIAVVMVMYAGFLWITAAGNTSKVQEARDQMNAAVIGLILTLTSYLLLSLINPDLVKLRSFNLQKVPKILQAYELSERSEKGEPPVAFDPSHVGNISTYDAMFLEAAKSPTTGVVDRDFAFRLKAFMTIESSGNASIVSPAGAVGLMQLLPSTAQKTKEELKDAQTNVTVAAAHIRSLLASTCPARASLKSGKVVSCAWPTGTTPTCQNGDWTYVAAAYNGGRGANCASTTCKGKTWWECTENPGFRETRNYVQKFRIAYQVISQNNWLPPSP